MNKKSKLRLNCFFLILLLTSAVLCGAAFSNMIRVDYKADIPERIKKVTDTPQMSQSLPMEEPAWNLILVNPWNKLPDDFSVKLTTLKNGHAIDERAYPDLQAMMDAARAAGLSPIICSSYRTNEKQQILFSNQVRKCLARGYSQEDAESEAGKSIALPGTSEHQTGLAVDIVALSYQILDQEQENTPEQKWLMGNAHKYGFILRYPSNKSEVTGIKYEP